MLVSKADSWMIDNGMKFFFMQKSFQLTQRIYFELKLSVGAGSATVREVTAKDRPTVKQL